MIDRYVPGRARTTCSLLFALFAVWTTVSSQSIIGASIGLALSGDDPEWEKGLGWGAGLIGISFLLQRGFKKHAAEAVQLYNYGLKERQGGFSFQLSDGGIGLRYQF